MYECRNKCGVMPISFHFLHLKIRPFKSLFWNNLLKAKAFSVIYPDDIINRIEVGWGENEFNVEFLISFNEIVVFQIFVFYANNQCNLIILRPFQMYHKSGKQRTKFSLHTVIDLIIMCYYRKAKRAKFDWTASLNWENITWKWFGNSEMYLFHQFVIKFVDNTLGNNTP